MDANASQSVVEYELTSSDNNGSWTSLDDNGSTFYEWEDWGDYYYPSGYSRTGLILTSLFVTAIMVLIVVGNMLVCIAIATEKSLKTVQNWFIASLAVSDFLVGLVVMPFSLAKEVMGYWIFGRFWCEMHSALDVFLCTASINSLCLISLDRYWSVTHAVEYLRKRTPRRSMVMIAGVWLLSAVISLPPLVGWKKPESGSGSSYPECLLSDDVGYVLYSAFGSFYVPAFVMVFVYCRIFVAARSRARRHLEQRRRAAQELTTTTARSTTTTTTTTNTTTSFGCGGGAADKSNGDAAATAAPQIIIDADDDDDDDDCEEEEEAPKVEDRGRHLFVEEHQHQQQQRRPSALLLRLKSPFGSTMSLADLGRSQEDVGGTSPVPRSPHPAQTVSSSSSCGGHQLSEAERQRRRMARVRERRATLILGLIMASFILAWLPFFVLYVLEALCRSACDIGATGFAIAFWLGYCNSALNPIIYTIFNRDFRRAFRKILFK